MPLIVTPRDLKRRAELYYQLGSLISAGVPLRRGLEMLIKNPPSGVFRGELRRIYDSIERGSTLTDALEVAGSSLPQFDAALISAGEISGRLDQCLKMLSNYYSES